jgi:hypothetical protein
MKLIKYGLFAVVGAFLLPAPPQDDILVMQTGQRINLETGEVISAAVSVYGDVSNFCLRQPGVCTTAGQAFTSLQTRVKYNFRRFYEWSGKSDSGPVYVRPQDIPPMPKIRIEQSALADPLITGSVPVQMASADNVPSINTLTIGDVLPEWRGPVDSSSG